MTRIYGMDYKPVPPSDIQERLAKVDPRLKLRYVRMETADSLASDGIGQASRNTDSAHEWWALTLDWSRDERRWHMVQNGFMREEDAYDVLVFLPIDCTPDQAYGFMVNTLRQNRSKEDHRRLLDRVEEYNREQSKRNLQQTEELGEELIRTNAKTLFREQGKAIPKVYMAERKGRQ